MIEQANELLSSSDPAGCDRSFYPDICSFLRDQRESLAKAERPDYLFIQRIDDVVAELRLLSTQTSFCDAKDSEVDRLQRRLNHARTQLQSVLDERARVESTFGEQRQRAVAHLQQQHDTELQGHDENYPSELPYKYRHVSGEVLQIREQERFLRQSRRYVEAQLLLDEADALEAFELERHKIRWHNDGVAIREAIVQRQEQEMRCLLDRSDRQWAAMIPDSIAREKRWRAVIEHIEQQIAQQSGDAEVTERTARAWLRGERLPQLLSSTAPNPLRKAAMRNAWKTYAKPAQSRPKSSVR